MYLVLGTRAAEHQGCYWGKRMVDGCFEWPYLALSHRNKFNSIAWLFCDGFIRKYQFTFTLHNSILLLHHHKLNSIDDQLLHVRIMKFPIKVNWDYWPINFNRWLKSIDICAILLGVSGIALGHMHLLRYFVQLFHFHYITLHYQHFKRHLHLKWPVVHQQLHVIQNTAHRPSTQASYTATLVWPKKKISCAAVQIVANSL